MDQKGRESAELAADRGWMWPLGIAAFAIAARAFFYMTVRRELWFQLPIADAAYYHDWALRIVGGDLLSKSEGVFFINPGYPYFLAFIYALLGRSTANVLFLQFLLGALSCVSIYHICSMLFGKPSAAIAGLLAGVYGISIFYESQLLSASLINFLNLYAILGILVAERTRTDYPLALAGILLGLSAAVRPNIVLFVPVVVAWMGWVDRRIAIKKWLLLSLPAALMLAPILIANHARGGGYVLTSSAGINFYMGSNPDANGSHSRVEHISHDVKLFKREMIGEASRRSGMKLDAIQSSRFWFNEGLRFIRENPSAYCRLLWTKFVLFWNRYEIPVNLSFPFACSRSWFLRVLPGFGLVAVLGLAGMALGVRWNASGPILLLLYALSTLASNLLLFVLAEYRHPIAAPLSVFAGYAVYRCWAMIAEKKYAALAAVSSISILAALFVYRPVPYDTVLDPTNFNLAVAYSDHGDHADAIRLLEGECQRLEAAGKHPDALILEHLGIEYYELRDIDHSLRYFDAAARLNPPDPRFWTNLGNVYVSLGKHADAARLYTKAMEIDPDYPDSHYWLGLLNAGYGSHQVGAAELEKSIALGYETPEDAYYGIGVIRTQESRYAEAADVLKKAVQLKPDSARLHAALGDAFVGMRRCDEALVEYEQASRASSAGVSAAHISAQRAVCAAMARARAAR